MIDFKKNQGITLVTLVITILTLSIIVSMVSYIYISRDGNKNVKEAQKTIDEIEEIQVKQEIKRIYLELNLLTEDTGITEKEVGEKIIEVYREFRFFAEKKDGEYLRDLRYSDETKSIIMTLHRGKDKKIEKEIEIKEIMK
ncbi:MAG: hypothetical protein ACTTGJ_00260 [Clostridium sp.]